MPRDACGALHGSENSYLRNGVVPAPRVGSASFDQRVECILLTAEFGPFDVRLSVFFLSICLFRPSLTGSASAVVCRRPRFYLINYNNTNNWYTA